MLTGLLYGTVPPFIVQIVNRITFPTAWSTTVLMAGVNSGVLFMPYIVDFLWVKSSLGPYTIFIILGVCHVVCVPLLACTKYVRYCFQD